MTPADADKLNSLSDMTPADADKLNSLSDMTPADADKLNSLSDMTPADTDKLNSLSDMTPADADKLNSLINTYYPPQSALRPRQRRPSVAPAAPTPASDLVRELFNMVEHSRAVGGALRDKGGASAVTTCPSILANMLQSADRAQVCAAAQTIVDSDIMYSDHDLLGSLSRALGAHFFDDALLLKAIHSLDVPPDAVEHALLSALNRAPQRLDYYRAFDLLMKVGSSRSLAPLYHLSISPILDEKTRMKAAISGQVITDRVNEGVDISGLAGNLALVEPNQRGTLSLAEPAPLADAASPPDAAPARDRNK